MYVCMYIYILFIRFHRFRAFSPDTSTALAMFSSKRPRQVLLHLNFLPGSSAGSRRKLHFEAVVFFRRERFGAIAIHIPKGRVEIRIEFPNHYDNLIVVLKVIKFVGQQPQKSSHTRLSIKSWTCGKLSIALSMTRTHSNIHKQYKQIQQLNLVKVLFPSYQRILFQHDTVTLRLLQVLISNRRVLSFEHRMNPGSFHQQWMIYGWWIIGILWVQPNAINHINQSQYSQWEVKICKYHPQIWSPNLVGLWLGLPHEYPQKDAGQCFENGLLKIWCLHHSRFPTFLYVSGGLLNVLLHKIWFWLRGAESDSNSKICWQKLSTDSVRFITTIRINLETTLTCNSCCFSNIEMGVSINGGTQNRLFMMENTTKMDDLGVPPFMEIPK